MVEVINFTGYRLKRRTPDVCWDLSGNLCFPSLLHVVLHWSTVPRLMVSSSPFFHVCPVHGFHILSSVNLSETSLTLLLLMSFLFYYRMVTLDPTLTKMLINKNEDVEILAWDQLFERLVGAFLYLERQIKDKAKWDVSLMFWLFGENCSHRGLLSFVACRVFSKMNKCHQITFQGQDPVIRWASSCAGDFIGERVALRFPFRCIPCTISAFTSTRKTSFRFRLNLLRAHA